MARCLRCHAGNEWIEGTMKDLSSKQIDALEAELKRMRPVYKAAAMIAKTYGVENKPGERPCSCFRCRLVRAYDSAERAKGGK